MAFYDLEIRTLYSGDLFGGLNQLGRVHMIAQEGDWAGIAQFHQIYMPTREALRYAVRQIRALDPPVEVIAPQHGYVITEGLVPLFLDRMHELLVGLDLLAAELDEIYLEGYREVLASDLGMCALQTMGRDEVISRLTARGERRAGATHSRPREGPSLGQRRVLGPDTSIVSRLIAGAQPTFANTLRETVLSACATQAISLYRQIGAGLDEGGAVALATPAPPGETRSRLFVNRCQTYLDSSARCRFGAMADTFREVSGGPTDDVASRSSITKGPRFTRSSPTPPSTT